MLYIFETLTLINFVFIFYVAYLLRKTINLFSEFSTETTGTIETVKKTISNMIELLKKLGDSVNKITKDK
jgi:hypothetical protein